MLRRLYPSRTLSSCATGFALIAFALSSSFHIPSAGWLPHMTLDKGVTRVNRGELPLPKRANITPRFLTAGSTHGRPDGAGRRKCTRPERVHRRRVLHQAARRPRSLGHSGRASRLRSSAAKRRPVPQRTGHREQRTLSLLRSQQEERRLRHRNGERSGVRIRVLASLGRT